MRQSLAERSQALRCLQVIDDQAQRGQAVTAMQVVVRMGLVDAEQAERVDAITREELARSGGLASSLATTSFHGNLVQSGVARPPSGASTPPSGVGVRSGGPPPPPPPLPGQPPRGASTSQTLPPTYARATTPPSGVARPPSGLSAPPPPPAPLPGPPAPLPGPPPMPGPLSGPPPMPGPPPRPASLPPGVSTAPIPRALTGEETMAGADLTFTRPPDAPPGDQDELYDLAENGQGLDDFLSGPKIGRGPVGTSYEGKRKSDGAPVVVKVLSRRFAQHPDLLAQVLEDVGAWTGLRHQNLTAALAIGVSNDRHVMIFERAPGATLEQHLKQSGRLEPRAALRVVYELAQALVAAQERGLSHGDLRPGKVYYDGQHARLADPGLARASCLAAGFGQYGLAFGHPTYLAPEVLQERLDRPTPATDVYSLGILFYELVCGVPPFQGEVVDVLSKHFDAPLPPPPQGVTFSAAIAGLMLRMTARSPSQRLPDARAVVTAITNLLEGKPIGPVPAAGARPAKSPAAAISVDEWGQASQREDHKGISNHQWTVSKIEQAPAVGPPDLGEPGPLVSESGGLRSTSTTGRLPREIVDEAALLAQAPGAAIVGEKLGRGPVGTTYEGKFPGQTTPVVVKVLSKKFSKHPDLVRRILDGVRAGAALNNPGVVRAVKAFQVAGRDMIVFERAPGRTLREVLSSRGAMPWRQATARVLELARTLEAARRQGVSHGDVRPEKVFIDDGGRARLADFGLAEAACLGAGFGAAGMAFGHPNYLAPEVVQERRREPDERTDIYALGILYYELLCGRAPFQANEPKRALVQHFEAPLPPPPDGVTIPTIVAELILRMTAKDPARRLATFSELVKRLEQAEVAASQDMGDALPSGEDEASSISASSEQSAGLSGVGPLEYDPAADDVVDPDAWGNQSLELAKPSGEWVKAKIAEAPKIGPEEWTPDQSDLDDVSSSGAMAPAAAPAPAKSAAKGTLAAAIQAAADTRESTPDGAAAPTTRDSARVNRKRAAGGQAAKAGAAPASGGDKKQLVLAVSGIAVTLLVMVVLMLRGGNESKRKVSTQTEGLGVAVEPPPPPPEDPQIKQRQALLKRLEKELDEADREVEDLVRSQRFREAAAVLANLSNEARQEPSVQTRILALEERVRHGANERLSRVYAEIDAACGKLEFERARDLARAVSAWAPDPTLQQQALQRVVERRRAYDRPVEELALEQPIDPASVEMQLKERLRGWGDACTLFPKGGVVVQWTKPDVLFEDLDVLQGAAAVDLFPDGRNGIRVLGEKGKPALIALKLPMKRLLDATLELRVMVQPGASGRAALVMGARPPQPPRGFGVVWGTGPVRLTPRGLELRQTTPTPTLPVDQPLRIRLIMDGDNRLAVGGALWIGAEREMARGTDTVDAGQAAGRLALWVEEAEVWITGLEVRGLLDPSGL